VGYAHRKEIGKKGGPLPPLKYQCLLIQGEVIGKRRNKRLEVNKDPPLSGKTAYSNSETCPESRVISGGRGMPVSKRGREKLPAKRKYLHPSKARGKDAPVREHEPRKTPLAPERKLIKKGSGLSASSARLAGRAGAEREVFIGGQPENL